MLDSRITALLPGQDQWDVEQLARYKALRFLLPEEEVCVALEWAVRASQNLESLLEERVVLLDPGAVHE